VLEVVLAADSPVIGRLLGDVRWPSGSVPVSVLRDRRLGEPYPELALRPGDRVALLTPTAATWLHGPDGDAGPDDGPRQVSHGSVQVSGARDGGPSGGD